MEPFLRLYVDKLGNLFEGYEIAFTEDTQRLSYSSVTKAKDRLIYGHDGFLLYNEYIGVLYFDDKQLKKEFKEV